MAQKSDKTETALTAPSKPAARASEAVTPVAVVAASGDPDTVVTTQTVGDVTIDIRQRDAQRGATAALRSELRSMVRAQRLAAALADGLTDFAEIAELPSKVLDVKIEARRRGTIPRLGGESK